MRSSGRLVVAGGFDLDQFANRLDHLFLPGLEVAQAFVPDAGRSFGCDTWCCFLAGISQLSLSPGARAICLGRKPYSIIFKPFETNYE